MKKPGSGPRRVRLSIKAIIIQDGHLLAIRQLDALGEWYTLPGGGQHALETIPDALRRECLEEIGSDVAVGRLRFIRDYIGRNHEFAAEDGDMHQVELMFECRLLSEPCVGDVPDTFQTGIEWLDLSRLADYRLYPSTLRGLLTAPAQTGEAIYLGDVN
jgi:8-oxo-dGTP diphosphatase